MSMRNSSFAVFIMVHGRPDKMWTEGSLRSANYTGDIYFVADDLDESAPQYKVIYGDNLIVFDKRAAYARYESGDNSGDLRSTLYAANTIFDIARGRDIEHFMIMCDDYTEFSHSYDDSLEYRQTPIKNLDDVFDAMIDYFRSIPALTIAMAQGGDFIGGKVGNPNVVKPKRKAMNTFLCSIRRPFEFMGRMNEDVTTYVNLGYRGELFMTIPCVRITQRPTQSESKGLTEMYLSYGTYVKSFFSVMYNPSCIKVSVLPSQHPRIHHRISWNNAVPKIMDEKYCKRIQESAASDNANLITDKL